MARLIDADELWQQTFVCEEQGDFRKAIENALTIDAVQVVRCRDCVYNENGQCTHSENYDDTRYRPDYFCADGERKGDE